MSQKNTQNVLKYSKTIENEHPPPKEKIKNKKVLKYSKTIEKEQKSAKSTQNLEKYKTIENEQNI